MTILSCENRTQRAIVSKDSFHVMPSSDLTSNAEFSTHT
jgi:hypothetical protein